MNKQQSIYLDLVRFFAALLVLIFHLNFRCFYNIWPGTLKIGHDAVIIFFVLSGYVIAYVADTKEKNIKDYFISRFSRLYSVLIPALILTFVVDKIGLFLDKPLYEGHFAGDILIFRLLSALSFSNQFWFHDSRFMTNSPLWSLSYEFWYYVLFALAFYLKNGILKYILIILTGLLVGPKILILLPVWGLGVLVYRFHKKITISNKLSINLFISSIVLIMAYAYIYHFKLSEMDFLSDKYINSRWYLSDYILGLILSLNIFSSKYVNFNQIFKYERIIRNCASVTFSIYLFHLPLLFFYAALLKHQPDNLGTFVLIVVFTLTTIYILAEYTEKKKYVFKNIILYICNLTENLFSSVANKLLKTDIDRINE